MSNNINHLLDNKFISTLQELIIFKDEIGVYQLFNKYSITKTKEDSYRITTNTWADSKIFFSLKNAVTWCIFDKRNKICELNKIEELDKKLSGMDTIIQQHSNLIKKSKKAEDKLIFLNKLSEDKIIKKRILKELNLYEIESTAWQMNRFSGNTDNNTKKINTIY